MFAVEKHADDATVSLQAKANSATALADKGAKALRADDKHFLGVDAEGAPTPAAETGSGDSSRFHIEIVPEGKFHAAASAGLSDGVNVRLENRASGKYLRFVPFSGTPCVLSFTRSVCDRPTVAAPGRRCSA